jgi:hypothetical protein
MNSKRTIITLLLAGSCALKAQTTTWATSLWTNPINYTSDGQPSGGSLTWSIGWFDDGFVPTAENHQDWLANYNLIDTTPELTGVFYGLFKNTDVDAEAWGKQAYIFAYNNEALIGQPGGEALLFTEVGFVFPDEPNQGTFDVAG